MYRLTSPLPPNPEGTGTDELGASKDCGGRTDYDAGIHGGRHDHNEHTQKRSEMAANGQRP
jgi:hypothetical protein